jgi:hypothetical protein
MRLWVVSFVAAAALAALGPACEWPESGRRASAEGAPAPVGRSEAAGQRPPDVQTGERRGDRHARAAARRAPGVKEIAGTVSRAGARTVAIRPAGAPPLTLRLGPRTTITVDGRPARLDALREGAEVRASYRTGGGRPTAIAIEAHAPAPDPPSPEREPGGASWGTSPELPPVGGG